MEARGVASLAPRRSIVVTIGWPFTTIVARHRRTLPWVPSRSSGIYWMVPVVSLLATFWRTTLVSIAPASPRRLSS